MAVIHPVKITCLPCHNDFALLYDIAVNDIRHIMYRDCLRDTTDNLRINEGVSAVQKNAIIAAETLNPLIHSIVDTLIIFGNIGKDYPAIQKAGTFLKPLFASVG